MQKISGNIGVAPIECVNPRQNKWRVRWAITPTADGEETAEYMEHKYDHRPTPDEVRQLIIGWHNARIDAAILSGFVWRGNAVWLSAENQSNYKAAFDAAVMSDGALLPVTFKFGTGSDPVYHEFRDIEELKDFYYSALRYVQQTLADGWRTKDSVDFSVYE